MALERRKNYVLLYFIPVFKKNKPFEKVAFFQTVFFNLFCLLFYEKRFVSHFKEIIVPEKE